MTMQLTLGFDAISSPSSVLEKSLPKPECEELVDEDDLPTASHEDDLEHELHKFSGSESYTNLRYPWLRDKRFLLTDGANYLAQKAKAFWLMDAIASHQTNKKVASEGFQGWRLFVWKGEQHQVRSKKVAELVTEWEKRKAYQVACNNAGANISGAALNALMSKLPESAREAGDALLVCDDGNGNVLATQEIPYTDFPLSEITLYVQENEYLGGLVVMLPSEY